METFRIRLIGFAILFCDVLCAQNPIIRDQFTADPTARVFNGKVYLYPSHDILAKEGQGRPGWFCMADYHVFSSENLTDWTDHGVILSQERVDWVDAESYSMWAPDCIERNGKYYFYFPANNKGLDSNGRKMFSIGVAIADHPEGPYTALSEPIKNVRGIDPNVFIDKDGQAYLYWSQGNIYGAKLKENMTELDSDPVILQDLPIKGLKEGPFVFERMGIYYLTFPHVENQIERLEYGVGKSPLGPFKMAGVIMDESPNGCWTNHHSFINFKDQWYLFYHQNDLSPQFDKNRSVRIDSLAFNPDGTIRKVTPTLRGVGLTDATQQIQIDRYSNLSDRGVQIKFIDTLDNFKGWKTIFNAPDAWLLYNSVDFGKKGMKTIAINALAKSGGTLQVRLNKATGPLLAEIKLPKNKDWKETRASVLKYETGVQNLCFVSKGNNPIEIDWVSFR
jgi:hypothetical protein